MSDLEFTPEQIKLLDATTNAPLRRQELVQIVRALNYLHLQGKKLVLANEVAEILRASGAELPELSNPHLGGLLGEKGLRLKKAIRARTGFRYEIPNNGIDEAYLRRNGIILTTESKTIDEESDRD